MPVWFGIIVAFVSTAIMNFGLALQKRGAAGVPKIGRDRGAGRALFTNRTWLLGLGGLLLGWGLYFYSAKIAPISVVQPALGMGLVVLALFSVFYLKERIKPVEWASLACMIAGMVLLGVSAVGDKSAGEIDWTWLLVITGVVLALTGLSVLLTRLGRLGGMRKDALLGIISGLFIGTGALYMRALILSLDEGEKLVAYAVCLPVMIASYVVGIGIMQSGFQHGKALVVVGLEAVLNKVVAIIGGIVALGELMPESGALTAMRITAFVLILFGSAFLSRFGEEELQEAGSGETDEAAPETP